MWEVVGTQKTRRPQQKGPGLEALGDYGGWPLGPAMPLVSSSCPSLFSQTHSLSLTLSPGGCTGEVAHFSLSLPLIGAEILI